MVGALVGGFGNPVYNALRTTDGITDDFPEHFRQGAVRGAIAFPVGFGILDLLSSYF